MKSFYAWVLGGRNFEYKPSILLCKPNTYTAKCAATMKTHFIHRFKDSRSYK